MNDAAMARSSSELSGGRPLYAGVDCRGLGNTRLDIRTQSKSRLHR